MVIKKKNFFFIVQLTFTTSEWWFLWSLLYLNFGILFLFINSYFTKKETKKERTQKKKETWNPSILWLSIFPQRTISFNILLQSINKTFYKNFWFHFVSNIFFFFLNSTGIQIFCWIYYFFYFILLSILLRNGA